MVRNIIYISIIFCLLGVAALLVFVAPYHIYTLTLSEGVNTNFLQMNETESTLYDGEVMKLPEVGEMYDKNLFEKLHFGNYELILPMNHSLFSFIPEIRVEGQVPYLGGSFLNGKNVELFSFMIERPYKFQLASVEQKIFQLPIFKNYIDRKSQDQVWSDIYSKKISLPSAEGKGMIASYLSLQEISYKDLVYNLYILYNRKFQIREPVRKFAIMDESRNGYEELIDKDESLLIERINVIRNGIVYPIRIKTKKYDPNAVNFRNKFLAELEFKMSSKDSAIPIYAKYKQLRYAQRLDQHGMTYLYSAWSHDLNNEDFVRVIILFLERGQRNLRYLKPFYEFSYRKFGSTFSGFEEHLNETAAKKLGRKIEEELEADIRRETSADTKRIDGQFSNEEEKIQFNLQRAKEKSWEQKDGQQKSLIME